MLGLCTAVYASCSGSARKRIGQRLLKLNRFAAFVLSRGTTFLWGLGPLWRLDQTYALSGLLLDCWLLLRQAFDRLRMPKQTLLLQQVLGRFPVRPV